MLWILFVVLVVGGILICIPSLDYPKAQPVISNYGCKGGIRMDIETAFDNAIEDMIIINAVDWTAEYRKVRNKKTMEIVGIDFNRRPYLLDLYRDCTTPGMEVWIMKARQMEISTMIVNCIHYLSWKYHGSTHGHAFPMHDTRNDFSDIQLKPMYIISPKMNSMMDKNSVDNKHLKSFINTSNYLLTYVAGRGKKSLAVRSLPLDSLWMDERDDFPPEHEGQLIESTARSGIKIVNRVGTPKLPDSEFDKGFRASTMHKWHITCPKCSHKQVVTLKHIMRKRGQKHRYYGCNQCRAELDRMVGEWIPTNPDGLYKGYHLNQLTAPWLSADDITKNPLVPYTEREFMNEVMGSTFAGKKKPIQLSTIYKCLDPMRSLGASRGTGPKVLCGDWGNHTRWIVIQMTRDKRILILDTGVWMDDDVNIHASNAKKKMLKEDIRYGVFCAGYGKANNQKLMGEFPGRFYSVFFSEGKTFTIPQWNKEPLQYHITIDHTTFCEHTKDLFNPDALIIPWAHCDPTKRGYDLEIHEKLGDLFSEWVSIKAEEVMTQKGKKMQYDINPAHGFASLGYGWLMLKDIFELGQEAKHFVAGKARRVEF